MSLKQSLAALPLLCAIGACSATAFSDVVFDNFGPNNSSHPSSGYGFGGSNPNFEQAMGFTPSDTYLLSVGEFALSLSFGSNPVIFDITVHADAGGLPGAAIETVAVHQELGPFGQVPAPLFVGFAGTTTLHAGVQYWISMSAGPFSEPVWNHNIVGDVGPRAFRVNGGSWSTLNPVDTRSAFRLHGTLVPAPGAIALLCLCACVPRRRR